MLISEKSKNISFIFDLDGTLIDIKGEGKFAYLEAFKALFNLDDHIDALFKGGIDYSIFTKLCEKYAILYTSRDYKKFQRMYYRKFLKHSNPDNWIVYEKVYNLLDLLKNNGFSILCATGNFAMTAKYKLKMKNLDSYFEKIFPNKLEKNRTEVFAQAKKYAESKGNSVIFIGDSEQDIEAANNLKSPGILVNHTEELYNSMVNKPSLAFASMDLLFMHLKENINGGINE